MRPSFEKYLLALADVAATRATCEKRRVGAVVANADKFIVAVSYNGVPTGCAHCIDLPCKALTQAAPASHIACRAIHAETNALILAGREAKNGWLAITTTPCAECAKLIVNAQIKHLVVGEVNRLWYDEQTYSISPRRLLKQSGVEVIYAPTY